MNTPSYIEDHISQIPALQLLIKMRYHYIAPEEALELLGGRTSNETCCKKTFRFGMKSESENLK
ncbi:hypothetical protein B0A58_09570 [Flavobacterium branchiophilum NBRC 15030 = ATCC 35035]|uniref:Uncharacterized protein n=1 Tax=Flavobacterium branchiophilum TaxID=55197 RepID=A0A543G1Q3_9FLAO|nr:hypothetical protein [Flavobacterium branchiophilum]OXA74968.1 hypothetical protein B0A58_09570 [Flavobacterium branchiophilum NBRC 15030 = ATCC 35035]TQM40012.1 hypothetical protein BC670_0869 [Flavobacterium branchiophilum]GEM55350.1 hypothetical protein FB1_15710 [Flavobacterium branchiophilum NBRC 15030 = ATCC 35035]